MIVSALISSLVILFFHATTWEGHIFSVIKKIIKPDWKISKPLYGCPICMSPYYGTIFYLVVDRDPSIFEWLALIFTTGGFSVLWVLLISIKDYLKPKQD